MTITTAKACELSTESTEKFKNTGSFSNVICRLEQLIKNTVDADVQSVTALTGLLKKINGCSLSEKEWQAVVDKLIMNGFKYTEYRNGPCKFYTISW